MVDCFIYLSTVLTNITATMSRKNITNAQLLDEIRELKNIVREQNNRITELNNTQALLLRLFGPLFPRVGVDPANTNEEIDAAANHGNSF